MASWFDRFSGKRSKTSDSRYRDSSVAMTSQQGSPRPTVVVVNAQREILRTASQEVFRNHGIPQLWFGFESMTVQSQGKMTFQVMFTLKFWDDALPLYFSALEAAFMARVSIVDPELADLVRSVSWRIAPEAGCPYGTMPEAPFWTESARQERIAAKKRLELNQLFADEWREEQPGSFSATQAMGLPQDFAATQPFESSRR